MARPAANRRRINIKFGKTEILFTIAAGGFAWMIIAYYLFDQQPSTLLLGAILSVLGVPMYLEAEKR